MKLQFLSLDKLSVGKTNMRCGAKAPDITDILPSVRARGVLVPILVRPGDAPEIFEIVAGRRRHAAACVVADERRAEIADIEPMPCAIIESGDDAAALEASLIENIARLDPDEVTRWETFTALVEKGRSIDDLSTTFGLPDLMIRRTLALGNLLPRIRHVYQRGEIDGITVRHLTLASKAQQKAWLALFDDGDAYCPSGQQLKAWLFGGQSIPTKHALFDLASFTGSIVTDLFGDGGYFVDTVMFWAAQNAEIEQRRAAYLEAGWADAVIVPPSEQFSTWDYEKAAKRKGGRVYIDVRANGEVTFHEGYVSRKEAAKARNGGTGGGGESEAKPVRPEISGPMQTYVDLHRHAAVRADLLAHPGVALRLMVAHAMAGSSLWRVSLEPRTARNDAIAESAESSAAEGAFDAARRALLAPLGLAEDEATLSTYADDARTTTLFLRLIDLPDTTVMAILSIVMGETLGLGGVIVEAVGTQIGASMAHWWQADDAFFDTLRDREVLGEIVAEVAGDTVARANAKEKGKTLKAIIRAHLDGSEGRSKVEHWVPRWMRFAPSAYTARGGIGTVAAAETLAAIRTTLEDEARVPNPDEERVFGEPNPDPNPEPDRLAA